MLTVEVFSRLVGEIYAAAVNPQHWHVTIREIHTALGGTGAALLTTDARLWSVRQAIPAFEPEDSYSTYYQRLDHVTRAVANGPVGAVRTGTELLIPYRHGEFASGWLRPNGIADGLLVRLTDGDLPTCFIVHTSSESEPFDSTERLRAMSQLVTHLQQALRTQDHIARLSDTNADLAAALDAVSYGVALVGPDGVVVRCNTAAEKILCNGDGMGVRSGRLTATNPGADRELSLAIRRASTDDGTDVPCGRSLICPRPSAKRPYVIHVLPVRTDDVAETARGARALVLAVDPETAPEPSAALLRRLYGLTRTEAVVAERLMQGADAKLLSEQMSVSMATVRTHIQHVLDKTGTRRQTDLVRLLMRLNP